MFWYHHKIYRRILSIIFFFRIFITAVILHSQKRAFYSSSSSSYSFSSYFTVHKKYAYAKDVLKILLKTIISYFFHDNP